MAQIDVSDKLLAKARSLAEGEDISDNEIMDAALCGWIVGKQNQPDLRQYRGKLHWDPEFAGFGPNYRDPVWT